MIFIIIVIIIIIIALFLMQYERYDKSLTRSPRFANRVQIQIIM